MIKKYEIITVGADKRVKALRSFSVQGRFVNIGDVGGIVYDENTLSQEGNAWIFSGNLGYPSIRVGGDSIVDTNGYEGAVTDPRPFVNITGTSALIGAHEFVTGKEPTAKELAAGDVEQGDVPDIIGTKYDESKVVNANVIRLKSLIYMGGISVTVTLAGEGYEMKVLRYGADKKLVSASAWGNLGGTGAANYIGLIIRKSPTAAIVPADITAAKVSIPSTAIESALNINDSRIVFNYTSAMTVATKVNAGNSRHVDVYKSVIDGSNLSISKTGGGAFTANILADVIKCNVEWRLASANSLLIGNFYNIGRLVNDGSYSFAASYATKNKFNVRDCYTFSQSETVIPTSALSAAPTNMPFTFIRCNVPDGRFYHNATIKNTYTDIDFSKAQKDLRKTIGNYYMASSEVEGMYRLYTPGNVGSMLVEDYESVKDLGVEVASYNTTIYKDAYFTGKFKFAGTNVFGNKVPGHPRAVELKARPRVVQGTLNALVSGSTVTGVVPSGIRVVTPIRYRINSGKAISVKNLPAGIRAQLVAVNERNVIGGASGVVSVDTDFTKYATFAYAYLIFSKTEDATITPDELGETTITVYNGCKIVNTGTEELRMEGAIRVEDNATLVNTSVAGSGYFGGNSVTENANVNGSMLIKDNAVFAPVAEASKSDSYIYLEDRARFLATSRADANSVIMKGDAVFSGRKISATVTLIMRDNARCEGAVSGSGVLTMNDDSHISAGSLSANGDITVTGAYKQTAARVFYGKRIIDNELEPQYDNSVKTKYDF